MATKKNPDLDSFYKLVKETVDLNLRSKAVTVERLLPAIDRLEKLYTHQQLVDVMANAGLDLTVGTFRSIRSRKKAAEADEK